jgi:hypothetical protein
MKKIFKNKEKKKFSENKIAIICLVATLVTFVGIFLFVYFTEKIEDNSINFNTYCAEGEILQKIDENEYLISVDTGHYFTFTSTEEFAENTAISVCFDKGETDEFTDDKIIAISINLVELQESLFTE